MTTAPTIRSEVVDSGRGALWKTRARGRVVCLWGSVSKRRLAVFVRRPSSFGAVEAAKPEMVDAGLYGGGYGTEGGNLAVVQRRIAWRTSSK